MIINDIDSIHDLHYDFKYDESVELNEDENDVNLIFDQLQKFENLGIDHLTDLREDSQTYYLHQIIDYAHFNIIDLAYYDEMKTSDTKLFEIGKLIYRLLCVDCYNTILPNYLESTGCINYNEFDKYFQNTLDADPVKFKSELLHIIKNNILGKLMNLMNLDENIKKNENYKEIIERYGVYTEIINYTTGEDFLYNYIQPVFMKNESNLIWRI